MRLIRLLKQDLAKEIADWKRAGIINDEQATTICARYGVDFHDLGRTSYGHRILVGLGYLFIGLALITLIGNNWEEIPRPLRMGGLIGLTLAANLMGLYRYRQDEDTSAVGWFLLGGLFYGASIMLIAQIYHIGEHYPDGIFWWALGVLPVALLLRSVALMLLSTTLAFIWFFVETGLDFYPTLFPLFLAAVGWFLTRGRQSNLLFLGLVAGIGLWAEYSLAWHLSNRPGFRFNVELLALGGGLTLLFYGVANWLASRPNEAAKDYGVLLEVWVLRFLLLALIVLSFEEPWEGLLRADWQAAELSIGLSLMLSAAALFLVSQAGGPLLPPLGFTLLFLAALTGMILLDGRQHALSFQIVDNIVLISLGIGLIVQGLHRHISHYFYLGVITILITGLMRYFDLVGNYIGAAILFAVFAAILLSAARYWKHYQTKVGETA